MDLTPFVQVPFSKYFQIVQKPMFLQGLFTVAPGFFPSLSLLFGTQKRFSMRFPA